MCVPKDMQKLSTDMQLCTESWVQKNMFKNEANRADDTSIKSWLFLFGVRYNKSAKSSLHFIFTSWCANIQ